MMNRLFENDFAMICMALLFVLGVISKFIMGISLRGIIKESENMNNTRNNLLKQIKLKYENCFRLHLQINNVTVFINKYMVQYKVLGLPLTFLNKFGKTCNLLCVALGIVGGMYGYINIQNMELAITYVGGGIVLTICGFVIENIVDVNSKVMAVELNIKDFLENSLKNKLYNETVKSRKNNIETFTQTQTQTQMQIPLVEEESKSYSLNDFEITNQIMDNSVIEDILKEYLA